MPVQTNPSLGRQQQKTVQTEVKLTASLFREVIRKEIIERHWRWLLPYIVLSVVSAVVGGIVVSGWVSVGVALAFAVVLFVIGLRAITTVRTIEKYPPT